ncbi:MAG: beta-ketoacyl-[acyl-carrier-protein] synthase II, partial [Chlamydiia bacterium]|nr:beta-ketoacyl-[acyl-carrier-protein] synthase II [Chlamydiia bacterium]
MQKKRVVVTGLGVVSCYGLDVENFFSKLLAGESGIRPIEKFDTTDYSTKFAGAVADFDTDPYVDKKMVGRCDPFIAFGLVGGKRALEHAGIALDKVDSLDRSRCGVIMGSGMGGMQLFLEQARVYDSKGMRRVSPFFIPYTITNMAAGILAMDLGFMGPNFSISTACATANHSISAAVDAIRLGRADLMICGGVEAAINEIGVAGFCVIKALSTRNEAPTEASRP